MKGSAIRYSATELAFLEARREIPRAVLCAAFVQAFGRDDVRSGDIKALCTRRGWTTGRTRWTPSEDAVLRALYPDAPTAAVARQMGRSLSATYGRAFTLGLCKSAAFLASPASGRTTGRQGTGTRFGKGHVPANKGVRRPAGWAPGRMKEGQFRAGERRGVAVTLYKPIGTERMSKEGYLERKIHDGMPLQSRWRAVHLIRWEAINGPKPKGMVLKCLDGDKQNTAPSNWTLISRALLPRLNGGRSARWSYDDAPAELKPTILAVAQLDHAARVRKKERAS